MSIDYSSAPVVSIMVAVIVGFSALLGLAVDQANQAKDIASQALHAAKTAAPDRYTATDRKIDAKRESKDQQRALDSLGKLLIARMDLNKSELLRLVETLPRPPVEFVKKIDELKDRINRVEVAIRLIGFRDDSKIESPHTGSFRDDTGGGKNQKQSLIGM